MNKVHLSICIPTYDRWEILDNTLESIYSQSENLLDQFEIIITNNNTQLTTTPNTIAKYSKYENLFYYKTKVKGFQNTTEALRRARGNFLKLSNDYTMFNKGSLKELIAISKNEKYIAEKPFIFFRNSNQYSIQIYSNIDEMISDNTYLVTWSTGYSFWKENLYGLEKFKINEYFPQLSLLKHNEPSYALVVDKHLFDNQEPKTKGGYNIFYVFGHVFLDLMYKEFVIESRLISIKTFKKIKSQLIKIFLADWSLNLILYRKKYSFKGDKIDQNLRRYYGRFALLKLSTFIIFRVIKKIFNKIKIWFNRNGKY